MTTKWIDTNGGPLIAMPRSLVTQWEGINQPSDGRIVEADCRWDDPAAPATDYDRACDVRGCVGVIPVGPGWGLVLGDEPASTCFVSTERGGVLVRWRYEESLADVEPWLINLPSTGYEGEACKFLVVDTPVILFDSSHVGAEFEECLIIDLPKGTYDLSTLAWGPDDHTALLLHRLEMGDDAS